ncbi:MAG: tetratricopeptide repeat protein [Bacteroidetes bacterium]|nr:tetratricopeptide repeat protein [Bacteroidota bacterium]
MKKIIFSLYLITCTMGAMAQDNLKVAFQKSYQLENNQQYKEALAALQAFNNPSVYEIQLRLGWLNYLAGNFSKSTEHYQRAGELAPAATEPLWGIIYPLSALEKWTGVENVYKEILKRDLKNTKANYYLGLLYYNRKDYTTAKKFLNEVNLLYPFDLDACLLLGWTHLNLGNKAEAKKLFNRVLLQQADNTSAKEGLGLCG